MNEYQNTVDLVKEYIKNSNYSIEKFYLFGSRARNDNHKDSDYDFMVLINEDIEIKLKRKLVADIYRYLLIKKAVLPMDLIIKNNEIFLLESNEIGYLSNTVLSEGIEL
jgi:predicted nucleotidyltransferase